MQAPTLGTSGVRINLVSKHFLDPMPSAEKIRFILDEVEQGKVLVLERGLTASEEAELIQATMAEIEQDKFIGIEMQSYGLDAQGRWQRLLAPLRKPAPRMVVIGPANLLKTVTKDSKSIEATIVTPQAAQPPAPEPGA